MSISAHDVAAYILKHQDQMSAMKLQKLVYYSQAWSLVWDDKPLFSARIQAWANGPVIPLLYREHRGEFRLKDWPKGDAGKISGAEKETIDSVLGFYGDKTAQWLSELTHKEGPWLNARKGLAEQERGEHEITLASMAEYYGSL